METVKATRIFHPRLETRDTFEGAVEIWACFDEDPRLDALLVTVHYNYGMMDNSRKRSVASEIVALLSGERP
jgi:hypothetical protein